MSSDFGARDSCERLTVTRSFSKLIEQGVLEIGDGYRAKNDELGGDGLIFLRAGHVRDTHIDFDGVDHFKAIDNSKLRGKLSVLGDVVVTTKGNSTGRIAFVTKGMPEFVYSPHLSFWRSKDESVLCQGFLRAWSRGGEFESQLQAMCRSTDMAPYLSLTDQKRLHITLPSIEHQREAAEILDGIEARITLLRETNATLDAIAQALFKSWFVDFDPVRAKVEGLQPESMDAATAALFPDSFEESELGLVPKGWRVFRVEDLMELAYGKALKATDRVDGQVPVYGSGGITGYHDQSLLEGPGIIVGRKGTVGSLYWEDCPFFPIDTVFYVKAKKPLTYCYYLLRTLGLEGMNTDGAVPGLNRGNAYRLRAVVPPEAVLEGFDGVASRLRGRIFANAQQAQTLTQLRDILLPRLISGQLRLPEAEALIEEAV